MDRIWAPWRMNYILESKTKGCLFCNKQREKEDKKNFIVWQGKRTFVILNIYPYNNGHLMVVPCRHSGDLDGLTSAELTELMSVVKKAVKVLRKILKPHGFNIGINIGKVSGAGVPGHVHVHVVPRWEGDTNFMPVVGNTKVICQSLDSLYKDIKKNW